VREEGTSIGRIVVGIDGSPGSAAAVRRATGVPRATGAEVIAVHLIEPPDVDIRPLGLPRAILNEADWRKAIQDELEGTWCAVGEQRQGGRRGRGGPRLERWVGRVGLEVQQRGDERDGGEAVGDRVVDLEEHAQPPAGRAGQEPQLPERAGAVQQRTEQP
jgi:nucleotide-binding universal stress UspA family protein